MSLIRTEDAFDNCVPVVNPWRTRWPKPEVLFARYPLLTQGDGPRWVRAYREGRKTLCRSGLKKRYRKEHLN